MNTTRSRSHVLPQINLRSFTAAAGISLLLLACDAGPTPVGQTDDAIETQNGLSVNGLSINGLSINGLAINGLAINGLATASFASWFHQSPGTSAIVMSYLVKCAVPAGGQLSWQDPANGTSYTWIGELGLAPSWSGGLPATVAEQQVISACLAAHANYYGVHVPIAVEGLDATGTQIPISPGELQTYSIQEGCFFGNLFSGDGVFSGTETSLPSLATSPRVCAMDSVSWGNPPNCSPISYVGKCKKYCTYDPTHTYYTQCSYGGKSYLPLATRMLGQSFNQCGDHICQFTESCVTCSQDCGPCQ